MGVLSVFSRCFGCADGGKTQQQSGLLGGWSPLPAEHNEQQGQRRGRWGWRSSGGGGAARAPAFGEGALREDEFAPQYTWGYRKRSGTFQGYQYNPFLEAVPEGHASAADPFATSGGAAHAAPAAEGWKSESGASAARPKTTHATGTSSSAGGLFGAGRENAAPPAAKNARAGSARAKQQRQPPQQQLRAFGEGALQKWH